MARPEAGPTPQPGERGAGPVRNGPYVAVPAGVEPGRASGTDPTRQRPAASMSITAAKTSTVHASVAKGRAGTAGIRAGRAPGLTWRGESTGRLGPYTW